MTAGDTRALPAVRDDLLTAMADEGDGTDARSRRIVVVTLILLGAAWVRFRDLTAQSLWFDEVVTTYIAAKPFWELIEGVRLWENTPPLFHLLVGAMIRLFGDTDATARFPSALAGVGAVWLTYLIGARLFSWRAGAAAALWMALSPYQLWFSLESRPYALMQCLGLGSCLLFLRLLVGGGRWVKIGYLVVTELLLWSHLYGMFVPMAQNLFYFGAIAGRRPMKLRVWEWLTLQLGVAVLIAPVLPMAFMWTQRIATSAWTAPLNLDDITRSLWGFVGSGPAMIVAACCAAVAVMRTRRREGVVFCLLLAACPVVVPVVVAWLTKSPFYSTRHGIAASAGLYLLAAHGLELISWRIAQLTLFSVIAVLPLLLIDAAPENWRDSRRPEWREAAAYLDTVLRRGDYVAINTGGAGMFYERYVKRRDVEVRGFTDASVPVPERLRPGSRVWLLLNTPRTQPRDILASRGWHIVSHRSFWDIEIWQIAQAAPASSAHPSTQPATLPATAP